LARAPAAKKDVGGAKKCVNALAFAEGFDYLSALFDGKHS